MNKNVVMKKQLKNMKINKHTSNSNSTEQFVDDCSEDEWKMAVPNNGRTKMLPTVSYNFRVRAIGKGVKSIELRYEWVIGE